ncbi:MAG TPA: FkbM family methyltransferase [Tepidisphaeraceae bacterium]|nr:FkbM family methyltransferase [Tepidisphaeraceae bacterium]
MQFIRKIVSDFFGLWRVCGFGIAVKWVTKIIGSFGECVRERNLQPADIAMGKGPFPCRYGKARAKLTGVQAISGIRELWVRDVYLNRGFLKIVPNSIVLDLGANMGNFTMLALAHGPDVRVVSVEPVSSNREKLLAQLEANNWTDRVRICPNFVGAKTAYQEQLQADAQTPGANFITEDELIQQYGLERIDFLKCDIEGSEFELLGPNSRLLAMARQIAIELHGHAGDPRKFIEMLRFKGFEIGTGDHNSEVIIVSARRAPSINPTISATN